MRRWLERLAPASMPVNPGKTMTNMSMSDCPPSSPLPAKALSSGPALSRSVVQLRPVCPTGAPG